MVRCSIEGCDRRHSGLGLCKHHYDKARVHGDPLWTPTKAAPPSCAVGGCDRRVVAKGMCRRHYERQRTHGTTDLVRRKRPCTPMLDRLMNRVSVQRDGCWTFTGHLTPSGYGSFWDGRTMARAHRVSYELLVGPIPAGLELDHLCSSRSCVNPAHLEPVTHDENMRRARERISA